MNLAGIRCLNSELTNGEPPAKLAETVGGTVDKQGVRHMTVGNVIFVLLVVLTVLSIYSG